MSVIIRTLSRVQGFSFKSSVFHASRKAYNSSSMKMNANSVQIIFYEGHDGDAIEVDAPLGKKVLDVAIDHDIDIEGACGGELACSTCHIILEEDLYKELGKPGEEEEDMLDLAWGLTDTSRLCCQIEVTKALDGAKLIIPDETNDML